VPEAAMYARSPVKIDGTMAMRATAVPTTGGGGRGESRVGQGHGVDCLVHLELRFELPTPGRQRMAMLIARPDPQQIRTTPLFFLIKPHINLG